MSDPGRTILFVHPSDELYGSDRCLLEAVRSLSTHDRAIVVLPNDLPYSGRLRAELVRDGIDARTADMLVLRRRLLRPDHAPTLLRRLVRGTRELVDLIRTEDVDLVHSNTLAVPCGALAARITGTPHLWQIHEHIGDEPRSYRLLLRGMLLGTPGLLIANSVSVARACVGGSWRLARRTRIISNAVSIDVIPTSRPVRITDGPIRIGVVGRLAPRKGIGEALEAAATLQENSREFELHFFGGPPPDATWLADRYAGLARNLKIDGQVHFHGEVRDIARAYAELDILLVPSQRPEPFGLVIVEGMCAGLPVVVTRNGGGSDDILVDGETGLYCGRAPEEIAATLKSLLNDPALRERLGNNAAESARRAFPVDHYRSAIRRAHDRAISQG